MSFVSVIANSEVITLVTDGRVTNVEDRTTLEENYKKYVKISRNQFIGYAGAKETCESVVNQLVYSDTSVYDLKQVSENIFEVICNDERLVNHDLLFVVGGLNPAGRIEFHTINRRENEFKSYNPESKDDFNYAYLYTSKTELDVENKLHELAGRIGTNSVNKRIRIQKELNNFIADHDNEVNKITFELRIRKN